MLCNNCSASVPEGHSFCGACGHRLSETIPSLSERLSKVEAQVAEDSRAKVTNQDYLELDTVERVIARVKSRTTLFLYFAGVPLTITAFAFAFTFGKGAWDIHSIAANAKTSVGAVLDQAQSEATEAKETATGALNTSKQVGAEIHETQRRVSELNALVQSRVSEAQKLNTQIEGSQAQVESLKHTIEAQSQKVQTLTESLKTAETQKSVATVRQMYPALFGERVVLSAEGRIIDAKTKPTDEIYIVFALWESVNKTKVLSDVNVGKVLESLQEHHYKTFLGTVMLVATTGAGYTNLDSLGPGECEAQGVGLVGPPCVIYFKDSLKNKAPEIRKLIAPAQAVPDERVRYVPPSVLSPSHRELVQIAGIDVLVVLGSAK